jgi:luciferase family oxidoreductase group 1
MLPHYSAYKIAEQFSLLANLYPERIDLGVGRAPGADMSTATVLATDGRPKFERFPQLVSDLCGYLRNAVSQPLVSPQPPKNLPVWMLGSSFDSAQLAADRGLPYNLAAFINPQADPRLIQYYRERFNPDASSPSLGKPSNGQSAYSILTISVFCADTEERAKLLQRTHDINLFRFFTGQTNGTPVTPEDAVDYPINPQLADFMRSRDDSRAVGTPEQVKEKVSELATRFGVDEIMAVTNMYYLEDRKRSFELLMGAFKGDENQAGI